MWWGDDPVWRDMASNRTPMDPHPGARNPHPVHMTPVRPNRRRDTLTCWYVDVMEVEPKLPDFKTTVVPTGVDPLNHVSCRDLALGQLALERAYNTRVLTC